MRIDGRLLLLHYEGGVSVIIGSIGSPIPIIGVTIVDEMALNRYVCDTGSV